MKKFENVSAVDFDLDGTLYPTKGEIDDRIRIKIAEKILDINPGFQNVQKARDYFEERYGVLQGGTKVLREVGYKDNAEEMMDWCLANADILDLIEPNNELAGILSAMKKKYELNLLTSSPEELSLSKLERLGINPDLFYLKFFSASKSDRVGFHTLAHFSVYPAKEHVYVGDSLKSDILPAKNLGMKTIAVGSDILEADVSIKNINNLKDILL